MLGDCQFPTSEIIWLCKLDRPSQNATYLRWPFQLCSKQQWIKGYPPHRKLPNWWSYKQEIDWTRDVNFASSLFKSLSLSLSLFLKYIEREMVEEEKSMYITKITLASTQLIKFQVKKNCKIFESVIYRSVSSNTQTQPFLLSIYMLA